MPNLLADPNLWKDASPGGSGASPPPQWDGTEYVQAWVLEAFDNFAIQLNAASPSGSTIEGVFLWDGAANNELRVVRVSDGVVLASVPLIVGQGCQPISVAIPTGVVVAIRTLSSYGGLFVLLPNPSPATPPVVGPNSIVVQGNSSANTVQGIVISGSLDSIAVASDPSHGLVDVQGLAFLYTPDSGYSGPDSFTYTGTNANGTSAPAEISITVLSAGLVSYNCECEDNSGNRTLGQLRSDVFQALGFVDPIVNATRKTLGELRASIRQHLGLIDPLDNPPSNTLGELIEIVLTQIGLADPLANIALRSLAALRGDVVSRLGFGAQSLNLPPGMQVLVDGWINEAQQILWRRLELDLGPDPLPPRMVNDSDQTTLDYSPVLDLALALGKAHYEQGDAKAYFEITEKYLADTASRRPPHIRERVRAELIEAQETVYRRYELGQEGEFTLAPLQADGDSTSIDYKPVLMLAVAKIKQFSRQEDAKTSFEEFEKYMADFMRRSPPGIDKRINSTLRGAQESVARRYEEGAVTFPLQPFVNDNDLSTIDYLPIQLEALSELTAQLVVGDPKLYLARMTRYFDDMERRMPSNAFGVVNRMLISAQSVLYRRYNVLRTERFYSWPLLAGVRLYDLPDNQEQCTKKLDPRSITWVGTRTDEVWMPLQAGINPALYSNDVGRRPLRYEIRQCIEVWPIPGDDLGTLVIKGHFGLEAFAADSDKTTIDDEAIFLFAVANAKALYKQPDAANYMQMAEFYIDNMVAGSHQTRRYIPGYANDADYIYTKPVTTTPFPS